MAVPRYLVLCISWFHRQTFVDKIQRLLFTVLTPQISLPYVPLSHITLLKLIDWILNINPNRLLADVPGTKTKQHSASRLALEALCSFCVAMRKLQQD